MNDRYSGSSINNNEYAWRGGSGGGWVPSGDYLLDLGAGGGCKERNFFRLVGCVPVDTTTRTTNQNAGDNYDDDYEYDTLEHHHHYHDGYVSGFGN